MLGMCLMAVAKWLQSYMKQWEMSDVVTNCKATLSWDWCCVAVVVRDVFDGCGCDALANGCNHI